MQNNLPTLDEELKQVRTELLQYGKGKGNPLDTEIARRTDLSVKTIWNAFNAQSKVQAKIKIRVLKVAKELLSERENKNNPALPVEEQPTETFVKL